MGSDVANATITGDFRNGIAYNSKFDTVNFTSCQMDRLTMFGSSFTDCVFSGCTMNQINLNSSRFTNVAFYECNLDMATFEASIFDRVSIVGGRAEYASFRDATFKDSKIDTQLHGADLRIAKSSGLHLEGSNTWGATMNVSCANFVGVTFDQRQLELLLALISKSSGSDGLRSKIAGLVSEHMMKVADRLIITTEEV